MFRFPYNVIRYGLAAPTFRICCIFFLMETILVSLVCLLNVSDEAAEGNANQKKKFIFGFVCVRCEPRIESCSLEFFFLAVSFATPSKPVDRLTCLTRKLNQCVFCFDCLLERCIRSIYHFHYWVRLYILRRQINCRRAQYFVVSKRPLLRGIKY